MTNAQREAVTKDEITFEYGELSFTIPTSENWPIDVIEAVEEGRMTGALKALLGDRQWAKFKGSHNTVGDLHKFFEAAGNAVSVKN